MRHPVYAGSGLPVVDVPEIKAMARAASRKATGATGDTVSAWTS